MPAADHEVVLVRPPGTEFPSIFVAPRRTRRRGPRSAEATARRSRCHGEIPGREAAADLPRSQALGPCEAAPTASLGQNSFSILQCNIRGFISHRAELEGQLDVLAASAVSSSKPFLVCVNETFLDESIENLQLGGYQLVSRRDRCDGRQGGGIALFAANEIASQVVLLEHASAHERSWHTIHSNIRPILCGVWYRPPLSGEIASIQTCEAEWSRLSEQHVASIIIGDLNVHHSRWLRHSSGVSVEGTALFRFCTANALRQLVKQPTREEHLLDLIISDLPATDVKVLPKVSDHNMVLADFSFDVEDDEPTRRVVFDYAKADWKAVRRDVAAHDWSRVDSVSVDEAERFFHTSLLDILQRNVPQRELFERKSKHPWINERCLEAIRAKNSSTGNADHVEISSRCSAILLEEYHLYIERMRDKLSKVKRGSKEWWKVTSEIVQKAGKTSSIAGLKSDNGWVLKPQGKSDLLADTFASKFGLPPFELNEYSVIAPANTRDEPVRVHDKEVEEVFDALDVTSGTGPDGIATRVLKECSSVLSNPFSRLLRRIVSDGFWPTAWTEHWLFPLYKRKSVYDPTNYRAINLTAQVSKAAERALAPQFVPQLEQLAFGPSQFAYRKKTWFQRRHRVVCLVLDTSSE